MMKCINAAFGLLLLLLLQACFSNTLAPVDERENIKERKRYTNQSSSSAKSDNKSGFHIVTKGETLYSIAWRYDKDFKEVARWNNIQPPYTIYPEQLIRLKPGSGQTPAIRKAGNLQVQTVTDTARRRESTPARQAALKPRKPVMRKKPRPVRKLVLPKKSPVESRRPPTGNIAGSSSPKSKKGINTDGKPRQTPATKKAGNLQVQTVTDTARRRESTPARQAALKPRKPVIRKKLRPAREPALPKGPVTWHWPTTGNIVDSSSPKSKKGINISGKPGQSIKAAAAGQVVYSGSGLFGYGKLIIIKHNDTYLSAYAYNSKLLVKEGDTVKSGQTISFMGQDHTGRTLLHFEIRKNGKPINPANYLPKKRA